MMKPIYFPFTYVPQWVAETLVASFKQFVVYLPSGRELPAEMQTWVKADRMEVRVPVKTDDQALSKMVKDFQAYASVHDDSKHLHAASLLRHHGATPFFGESAVSRIVSEVKKSGRIRPNAADFDPLFNARVFLEFAHEYDRQNDELRKGLGVNNRCLRELLEKIGSERENGLHATPLTAEIRVEDSNEYMALDRFQAWLRLYKRDPRKSGLFVTSSPLVFNHLIENRPAAQKVMQSEGLPVIDAKDDATVSWQDSFLKQLKQLVENQETTAEHSFGNIPLPENQRSNVRLMLYRLSGQGSEDIFGRKIDDQNADTRITHQKAEAANTLIGLIGRQPISG